MIENPVLKGFNPDPSAINVDGTVYIAVSTFQWMPGVRIYKTNDLVNYEFIMAPVNLDLSGHPVDTAIWAPNLSYYNKTFYLLYTVVTSTNRPFKDLKNYVITAKAINGPWSKPVYLNSNGFDPSFYHDETGSYLLQTLWDWRIKTPNKSAGIIMQKVNTQTFEQETKWELIFTGTSAKKTEAPNLYYLNNYYYLFTAEGGTGQTHQVTVARSHNIWGPYEVSPQTPLMTVKDNPSYYLQCAGHASLVEFKHKYYIYYLTKRLDNDKESILGRETSLAQIYFDDNNWPRLRTNDILPPINIGDLIQVKQATNYVTNFNELDYYFQMPFKHSRDNIKITSSGLLIKGMASIQSTIDLNMVGYRITNLDFEVETILEYHPTNFQQMAGISLYLNHENFILMYITDEDGQTKVKILSKKNNKYHIYRESISTNHQVNQLKIIKTNHKLEFIVNNEKFKLTVNPLFLNKTFSGTMIGLSAHDFTNYNNSFAIFKKFIYKGI